MAGRKIKITTNDKDRADQRRRTEELMTKTKDWDKIQPTPPRHLTGVAYAAWTELVPVLNKAGVAKQSDKFILCALCEQIKVERQAYDELEKNGIVLDSGRKNPAAQVLDSATAKVKSLSESLGLSPQARASLMNIQDTGADDDAADIVKKLQRAGREQF